MPAATVPLAEFEPLVRPYVRSLPVPTVRRLIRQAAIEFCERTNCWREIITVTVDEQNETVAAASYAAIHRIEEAIWEDDVKLTPVQFTDFSHEERTQTTIVGTPRYISQLHPNTVALVPYAPGTLTVSAFYKPIEGTSMSLNGDGEVADDLDVVPEFMLGQYGQHIAYGALQRAMMMRGTDHYDPREAMMYQAKFDRACDANFSANITMQHRSPPRSAMREY
jgi:histone H3/H4